MMRGLFLGGGGLIIRILRYIKMVEEEAGITLKNLDKKNGGGSLAKFLRQQLKSH